MAERPRGMGRGLAAILTTPTGPADAPDLRRLPVELVVPNPRQPRRTFDEAGLLALAALARRTAACCSPSSSARCRAGRTS